MDENQPRRPSISQMSKTPSWVMLGVIIGALIVLAWPREPAIRTVVVKEQVPVKTRPDEPPLLTTVESVFTEWQKFAVWDNDTTQVALWNSSIGDFAEFYEVRRVDGVFYFRSLPSLTRRVIRHGKPPPPECPLQFTETEEQYREWREQGRYERPAEPTRPAVPVQRPTSAVPKPSADKTPALKPDYSFPKPEQPAK